jgi:cyclase
LLSRRRFLETTALASLAGALPASLVAREARAPLAAQPLGERMTLVTGGGGNILALGSDAGALLVDGGNRTRGAAAVKLALRETGAKRVHTLFNTHWHPDQTGSNERLGKQGALIVAQENTRLWLARRKINVDWLPEPHLALPKPALPTRSFYTTDHLEFAGEEILFGHLGQAHTDGDLYVYFPRANVLAAGGVVSANGWPLLDWQTGGWIGGLVGAYDRLMKVGNEQTRVVPADGPVVGMAELRAWREMYFTLFDRCVKQLVKGMGPEEVVAQKPAREFEAQWGDSDAFVMAAFKSLWGHYAPDA